MIYRKKILLALTELFGVELSATRFQKLLFIFSNECITQEYHFIPYKFGCFSFQSMRDKKKLIEEDFLENKNTWILRKKNSSYLNELTKSDQEQLLRLKKEFKNYSTHELIKHVYLNYPYYAINSEIAPKHLSPKELNTIEVASVFEEGVNLFTIGYEGKSLEQYLNILIRKNVNVLCDVRKNPLSRKYGFSKKTLQNACEAVNIKYFHLPELGITSEKRKSLNCQADFDKLFLEYDKTIIPKEGKSLQIILQLINKYRRVALTCYENLPVQCHRSRVANALHKLEVSIPLTHL